MKKFAKIYLAFTFVLLYVPIFYLIFFSFNKGGDMNGFTGWTLENYKTMFEDSRLPTILLQTFVLAFLSALVATFIGTFGAIFIHDMRKNIKIACFQRTMSF